uniref:Uncharacterized protein n=1 Tax=Chromera velia CCMP2878 TaxID=1169474 RepID=A0A0G4FEP1_9ALVE|eukprot:Cvel_16621.t1-p1 / transcript=Cvel_16621.t1 / gene=Cvel_16621 / organism=Chromera_velia_CCMP2878 / gene_product=hypothetical protein / transcript_product=hypothetical protein / location=Cvel_scaffold1288:23335-23619(-) / protein_length=95 / sequence_SO=supercontig / SO=protein_coding / is_pseudo=false
MRIDSSKEGGIKIVEGKKDPVPWETSFKPGTEKAELAVDRGVGPSALALGGFKGHLPSMMEVSLSTPPQPLMGGVGGKWKLWTDKFNEYGPYVSL